MLVFSKVNMYVGMTDICLEIMFWVRPESIHNVGCLNCSQENCLLAQLMHVV
jgi:hypothetical protein